PLDRTWFAYRDGRSARARRLRWRGRCSRGCGRTTRRASGSCACAPGCRAPAAGEILTQSLVVLLVVLVDPHLIVAEPVTVLTLAAVGAAPTRRAPAQGDAATAGALTSAAAPSYGHGARCRPRSWRGRSRA